jgi:hypothetical protein
MEKIDQLFRDKLDHHTVTPSAMAWSKVEAQLPKKNKIIVLWRMAAALMAGGLLVATIIWYRQPLEVINAPLTQLEPIIQTPAPAETKSTTPDATVAKSTAPSIIKTERNLVAHASAKATEEKKTVEKIIVEQPLAPETHLVVEPVQQTVATLTAAEKPIVIEFVLSDVPEISAPVVAEVKETGIKKVWETVKEFKNGDRSIDLRHATQELFASNKKETNKNN